MKRTDRIFCWLGMVLALPAVLPARAAVYLNEMTVRPAGMSEDVELYNSGPDIDLGGWVIEADKGSYTIPPGTPAPGGGYVVLSVGDIMLERGGVTTLIDVVKDGEGGGGGGRAVVDEVSYGTDGSAPLPPAGTSLARAPDASFGAPPPPDPATDGMVWTIDFSPTFGGANDPPLPAPGALVVFNELDPAPPHGEDLIELFNPAPVPVSINGWMVVNGDAAFLLNGLVPPGGFWVVTTPPGFDLDEEGLVYLFDAGGVRLDQLGFHDLPPLPPEATLQRCPNGAGPYLGYDGLTSGAGETLLVLLSSLGATNCDPAGLPDGGSESTTWGRLRLRYQGR